MRLFFALWPPVALQAKLMQHAARLSLSPGARPVVAENLHLTLAFLGSVATARLADIEAVARGVSFAPFQFVLDTQGAFPRAGSVWLGLTHTPAALSDLVARLRIGLTEMGLPGEARAFHPHVTLARSREHMRPLPVRAAIAPLVWPVDTFRLVQSQTLAQGPIYRQVAEFKANVEV